MKDPCDRLPRAAALLWALVAILGCLPPRDTRADAAQPAAGNATVKDDAGDRPPVVLENELLRIAVDARNGAILGITNRKTNTEYMANRRGAKPPFILDTYSANQAVYIRDPMERQSGGFSLYNPAAPANGPADLAHVRDAVEGGVRVAKEQTAELSRITSVHTMAGGIVVTCTITLRKNSPLTEWQIQVANRGGETPVNDRRVYRVAFPVLEGLRIGSRHEANALARPYGQGELIPDPASYAFTRPKGATPINVLTYIGWASMPWQDLYATQGDSPIFAAATPTPAKQALPAAKIGTVPRARGGLYLASYDTSFQQLDVESWPDRGAGTMTLDMRTLAFLEPGQSWTSHTFEVGVHEGDWHWAADRYRQWATAHHRPYDGPEWVRKECDGWLGTGGPTQSYGDYVRMLDDARWLGLNYLQIWSEMIENVGPNKARKSYYCFLWPDPDRGGEAELTRAVRAVRAAGGHIGFYHNIWTWDSEMAKGLEQWRDKLPADVRVPNWWGESRRWASVFPDGSRMAGNFTNGYSGMCPAAEGYQDYVLFWVVERYLKRYGVDTWYFDSMPVTMFGASRVCFSDEHGQHQPHGVGRGTLQLLQRIREAARPHGDLAITTETVSDALMQYNSHALGIEMVDGLTCYPCPEIYTYTFPQHAIFSGTCNGAGSGLKYYYPDLEKPRREDAMNRVFLMGYRFDILMRPVDPKASFPQYMRRLIALRQQVKADLYASDFRDAIGLGPLPERVYAKLFRRRDGGSLTLNLVDRRQGEKPPFSLTIELAKNDFPTPGAATLYGLDAHQSPLTVHTDQGKLTLQIPALGGEVAAIVVRRAP